MTRCLCIRVMQLYGRLLSTHSLQAELPPWIVFSDFERTEWLTQMLGTHPPSRDSYWMQKRQALRQGLCLRPAVHKALIWPQIMVVSPFYYGVAAQMWPYVDSAVSDVGLQRLDKALKERRARWMLDVAVEQ